MMVARRNAVKVLAALLLLPRCWAVPPGFAQATGTLPRVAVISPGFSEETKEAHAFRDGLEAAGYAEGRNVTVDWWYGGGSYEGVSQAVSEAASRKAAVIVVESTTAALAAKRATNTIPIVLAVVGDPVGSGLVASLARPGGNITGLSNQTVDLSAKRLHLLKEAMPKARRVAVLWNSDTAPHTRTLALLKSAAPSLKLELIPVAVRDAAALAPALSSLSRSKADALMVLDSPFWIPHADTILDLASKARVPVVWGYQPLAQRGVLIAYSTPIAELFRRAAGYVDKILKGSPPASLPVEQPTKFELFLNLKTAKTLGLTIPESLLLQADEVIR